MPLYEYECKQCGRHTEKIQKFSDPEITECPHCGGPLERVISAPAISFKGGGWYTDLYSSPKPAAGANSTVECKATKRGRSTDASSRLLQLRSGTQLLPATSSCEESRRTTSAAASMRRVAPAEVFDL